MRSRNRGSASAYRSARPVVPLLLHEPAVARTPEGANAWSVPN